MNPPQRVGKRIMSMVMTIIMTIDDILVMEKWEPAILMDYEISNHSNIYNPRNVLYRCSWHRYSYSFNLSSIFPSSNIATHSYQPPRTHLRNHAQPLHQQPWLPP